MKQTARRPVIPSLLKPLDEEPFEDITPEDGVYPEPTEEDRRIAMRLIHGLPLPDDIT